MPGFVGRITLASLALAGAACPPSPGHLKDAGPCVDPPATSMRTGTDGTDVFLETSAGLDTARVALSTRWGGLVSEASLDGTQYLAEMDIGLRDGDQPNWFVFSSDFDLNGAPVLNKVVAPDHVYLMTSLVQWIPELYGGGKGQPVTGEAILETWLTPVPGHSRTFQIRYRVTFTGSAGHAATGNGLPGMYVNPGFGRFVYYQGSSPWQGDSLNAIDLPQNGGAIVHAPERWIAYADASGSGIALYAPAHAPHWVTFEAVDHGPGYHAVDPRTVFGWSPGDVLEFEVYLLLGPVCAARDVIYELHGKLPGGTPFPPWGELDFPAAGETLSGTAAVQGWAYPVDLGPNQIARVEILVDGVPAGIATYGISRPDISASWPGIPAEVAYDFALDTTAFPNGPHTIHAAVTDTNGRTSRLNSRQVTFRN